MKIWSLQILRFWAALAVVIYHANDAIYAMSHRVGVLGVNGAGFGRGGVDIFFVLSGVIIARTSKGLTPQQFIAKRARRILPLYGLVTAFYLTAGAFMGQLGWRQVVTSLTLWPALDRMVSPIAPPAWSLCFEVLFYASTALVLWRPRLAWAVFAAFAAALAIRSGPVTDFVGNPIAIEFLMGVGLTWLPRWRGAVGLIPVGLAAAWFLANDGYPPTGEMLVGDMGWQRLLYFGLPAVMVVWGTMQIEARKGVLTYLGDASYSLYLVHAPMVLAVVWALCRFTSLPPDVVMIAASAAGVVLGWRVHELFEKPMLAWFRKPACVAALA